MSIQQNFPNTRPSLNLNFARSQKLDPRITFTRTSSATRVNSDGLIEVVPANSPRFDFDPVTGECLGLLIEEQRANRCTQSVNFSFSATSNTTETTIFNPDGTAAVRRVPLSTGNFHGTSSNAADIDITGQSVGGTTDVTTSIFVRNYNNSNLRLLIGFFAFDATPTYRYFLSVIDTANPTTLGIPSGVGWSNGSTKVENYGNGWYRYTLSGRYTKATGYTTVGFVGEQIHSSTGQQFWFGDDVSGIYTWGKQIELGLFSTSYIPTSGSTVTRTADNASITGSNFSEWFNNNEFSIFTHHKFPQLPPNYYPRVFDINNGSDANRINHYHDPSIYGTKIGCSVVENNLTQSAVSTSAYTIGDDIRMASCFKDNDFASYVNGVLVGTDNSGVFTTTQRNVLYIGSAVNGGSPINGTISQLTYYPVRLSNQIVQNLTK
jgi:hypothetical protein